jgi:hypothetical protein
MLRVIPKAGTKSTQMINATTSAMMKDAIPQGECFRVSGE